MAGVDDHIGSWIKQAERSGELKRGRYWGKPFDFNDGFDATPANRRMAYKVLKNAGYPPWEVQAMNELAELRAQLEQTPEREQHALRQKIAELRQKLAVRLEKLAR